MRNAIASGNDESFLYGEIPQIVTRAPGAAIGKAWS